MKESEIKLGRGGYTCEVCGQYISGSAICHHTEMLANAISEQLKDKEPALLDKSVMIKLTEKEILNLVMMGAKYWSNAVKNNTTLSIEVVCQHHTDLAITILRNTDPDRFIFQS